MTESSSQLNEIPYDGPVCRCCGYPAPDKRKWLRLGKLGARFFGTANPPLCLVCWQFFTNLTKIKDIVVTDLHRRGIYTGVPKGVFERRSEQ